MSLTADPAPARTRGFSPLRDLPAVAWLLSAAVSLALHRWIVAPQWLVIHLVVLGAASHSVLVWSQYFTDTLLKTPPRPGERRRQAWRLVLLNGGALLVVAGVLGAWPLAVCAGATAVATAAAWHAVSLARQLRRALAARFRMVVRYYVTAAALLPLGALFGALLATGSDIDAPSRLLVSHVVTNGLGWLGITVAGTLVTLWPTMLRTRLVDGAETAAARALPWLAGGVAVTDVMALLGSRPGAAVGLVGYLVGVGTLAVPFARTLRAKPATDFAPWSVLAGVGWFVAVVGFIVVDLATARSWDQVHARLMFVTPAVAAGFAAQLLTGAMSYLLPVALGGGPTVTRLTNAGMSRAGGLRIAVVNAGLVLALLPAPALVHTTGWTLVAAGLAGFLVLVPLVSRSARRAKAELASAAAPPQRFSGPPQFAGERRRASAVTGVGVAAVALALAVGLTGAGSPLGRTAAAVAPTGMTTTIDVVANGMRFTPDTLSVPIGNRLVVNLRNADPATSHDLVFASGVTSGLLRPGERARVDVGVIGADLEGWCSVAGHRQMGMVLHVVVAGSASASPDSMAGMGQSTASDPSADGSGSASALIDLARAPAPGFSAYPAVLPPVPAGTVHRMTLVVQDEVREVAPGVTQRMWTYNGTVPGPVLHGRVGDTFDVTVINRTDMGHSIDFHAGQVAPDSVMRTIPPGGTLHYVFKATHAGIWMYHCSTMPMSVHIANGMFGAVVIDPPDLRPVAREYVLLQSELYLGARGGEVDAAKVMAERPDLVVFNGYANQYVYRPLPARVGERIRIWVLDAGPDRSMSFHVVGGQFDTVYSEGAYLLQPGVGASQALGLQPAQGGFVELSFGEPGHYTFVTHVMVDAERGARGMLAVAP